MGLTSRLDLGLTMREWGQPGDRLPATHGVRRRAQAPAPPAARAASRASRSASPATGFNQDPVAGLRLVASSLQRRRRHR
ncbi:MAG: hypothetical protein MZU95_09500 [Desulfomicrobium escambiense]|nr:hypothetical protein [Desulfomicrobium escambiense]